LIVALAFWPVSCSNNTTGPDEEDENGGDAVYGGLLFDYTTEPQNASSGAVSRALGGSVEATSSNGVVYSLEVPPLALASDQTITITPMAGLTITTMDSSAVDTSECLQGALFEPDGLEFEEPAVLTITLPAGGLDCASADSYSIVLLDDSSAFYEIMETEVGSGGLALTCSLTHFSGYATDDMDDYEFLKYLIVETSKAGLGFPGWDVLVKLLSYATQAQDNGWDDLSQLAIQGAQPILDKMADDAIRSASLDPSFVHITLMLKYTETADFWGFTGIESKLRTAIDTAVRAYASRGSSECAAGRHDAGKAMLRQAREWAMRGLILTGVDPFLEQIDDALSDCGDINITLSASTDEVYNVAIDEGQLNSCLVTFTATVTTPGGGPLEGKDVTIRWTRNYGIYSNGTTDSNGEFSATWTGAMILSTGGCVGIITEGFYAEAATSSEMFKSPIVDVTARQLPLMTSITYQHNYSDELDNVVSAEIIGEGTGFCAGAVQTYTCTGYLSRTYHSSNYSGTVDVIPDTLLMPACKASVIYEIATDGATGMDVPYVTAIRVSDISRIFKNLMAVNCPRVEGCRTTGFSMPTCAIEATGSCGTYAAVWIPALPGDGLEFANKGSGQFDPYIWSYSHFSGYGSSSLAITVGLDL
jgi:hypothetical protein